jgi:DNA-binding LacI/PurR family transcriptional regulator
LFSRQPSLKDDKDPCRAVKKCATVSVALPVALPKIFLKEFIAVNFKEVIPQSITIADVAKAAGVSVSTVSRILNDKPDVSEATRQRVQKIIEELRYEPHAQAQNLAAGKSRTIALLFPIEHTGYTQLELDFFIGAAQAAGERGFFFNLMTASINETNLFGMYRGSQVDGIILMQIRMEDWRVDFLRQHQYPFVMIGRCEDNTDLHYIDLDFDGGIDKAIEHLTQLGHQCIGFLTRPAVMREQQLGAAVRSLNGYLHACEEHSLQPIYREVDLTLEGMYQATLDLLEEQPNMTAIITINGATAASVIRALAAKGRAVPEDFSVLALTTGKIAQLMTPPLTSIDFPSGVVGYRAAEMLINQLESNPIEPVQILLPPELIIRESTARRT